MSSDLYMAYKKFISCSLIFESFDHTFSFLLTAATTFQCETFWYIEEFAQISVEWQLTPALTYSQK